MFDGMTPNRLRRIAEVYEAVLELEGPLRGAYLVALARDDLELVRHVHRLLDGASEETEAATPSAVAEPESAPQAEERQIGPYRLIELLGMGGMGTVHLAERSDSEFERRVAIKVIRFGFDVPEVRRRFLSERQILASFDHPNIAGMHEGGTTADGLPYLVMEYVEGVPIDRYCDENRLTVKARLKLFRQVCSAVEYAHQNLVVHRDLKPSNVLVTADGVPKLLDFGIAKLLDPEHFPITVEATETGRGPLTPSYASPEQIAAQRVTTLSDVYSLGVLLYRLLTGRPPFDRRARSREILAREAAFLVPTRPSLAVGTADPSSEGGESTAGDSSLWSAAPKQHRRQLQGDLDNIVLTALRVEPGKRYGSVQLLSEDVERHLDGEPVRARKASVVYRAVKFLRRNKLPAAAAVLFVTVLLGFLGVTLRQNKSIAEARDLAVLQEERAETVADFFVDLFAELSPERALGREVNSREILDTAAERLISRQDGDPTVRVRLLAEIGEIYYLFGEVDAAGRLLEMAFEEAQILGGLPFARATLEWSRYLGHTGSQQEALELGKAAAVAFEKSAEISDAAGAFSSTSLWASTEEMAVELAEKGYALAVESRDVEMIGLTLHNLSLALWPINRERSLEIMEQAVQVSRGPEDTRADPNFLSSLGNLAYYYQTFGRLAEARSLHEEVLKGSLLALGPNAPHLGVRHNNAAQYFFFIGEYDLVELHGRKTLEIWEGNFGELTPRSLLPLNKICSGLIYQNRMEEAREVCESSVKISKEHSRRDVSAWLGVARFYRLAGEFESARDAIEGIAPDVGELASGAWKRARFELERGLLAEAEGRSEEAAAAWDALLVEARGDFPGIHLYKVMWRLVAKLYLGMHGELGEELEILLSAGTRDREIELYCLGAGNPPICTEVE
ncbi:MAG: protein kinase, partial [Planctomycetota bacterium]